MHARSSFALYIRYRSHEYEIGNIEECFGIVVEWLNHRVVETFRSPLIFPKLDKFPYEMQQIYDHVLHKFRYKRNYEHGNPNMTIKLTKCTARCTEQATAYLQSNIVRLIFYIKCTLFDIL